MASVSEHITVSKLVMIFTFMTQLVREGHTLHRKDEKTVRCIIESYVNNP